MAACSTITCSVEVKEVTRVSLWAAVGVTRGRSGALWRSGRLLDDHLQRLRVAEEGGLVRWRHLVIPRFVQREALVQRTICLDVPQRAQLELPAQEA